MVIQKKSDELSLFVTSSSPLVLTITYAVYRQSHFACTQERIFVNRKLHVQTCKVKGLVWDEEFS
jgi:hypothetical protein